MFSTVTRTPENPTPATSIALAWAGATHVGQRRSHNEDAWGVFAVSERAAKAADAGTRECDGHGMLLVVCDGIGGSLAGEVASAFCVEQLATELAQRASGGAPLAVMRAAIAATHDALHTKSRSNPEWRGMGATLSALWLLPQGVAVLGHVGDSRVYALRAGQAGQLTEDHSVGAGMVRRGEITTEAASRLRFRAMLEQSMGGDGEPLAPQVVELPLGAGDTFLLCSDGLHGLVAQEELEASLRSGTPGFGATIESLIAAANAGGGHDNITAILARVSPVE